MPRRPQITIPVDADLRSWLNAKAAADVGTVASVARRILVEAMRAEAKSLKSEANASPHPQVIPIEWGEAPTEDEQAADPFADQ